MSKSAAIVSSVLVTAAACLLILALVNSAKPTIKIGDLMSGKIDKTKDVSAIFECYFFKNESNTQFQVSELIPCTNPEAQTIQIKLGKNVQRPELFLGAQLFLHGTYIAAENYISVNKIESSCPSKKMEMLEKPKSKTPIK